jgi:hypothetical protein
MRIDPTYDFLWQSLAIFLLIGAVLGILLGLALIFRPQLLEGVNRVANRWVTMRHITRWLDRSISIERWFYQYHGAAGLAILAGAVYIFIYFGFLFDKPYTLRQLGSVVTPVLLDWLLDVLVLSLLTGAAAALIAGLFLWLRPSLLRGMEAEANRWVSSRQVTKTIDVPHGQIDHFVAHHARQSGWLLLLGSIYLLFAMFRLLV